MKTALVFLEANKQINLSDYCFKFVPLLENKHKYDKIHFLITDTQFLESSIAGSDFINENINVILNMGFDNNIEFIKESGLNNIFINANKLSNYIYLSKIIKSPILKKEIQQQNESNTKTSNIFSIMNLISALYTFDADDVYISEDFIDIKALAKRVEEEFNLVNTHKIVCPNFIFGKSLCGLDGNIKISNTFNNNIEILISDYELEKKIKSIFTDPNHIRISDKGETKNNPLFVYIENFCDDEIVKKFFDIENKSKLEEAYRNGGIGDAKLKNMLYESVKQILDPLRKTIDESEIKSKIAKKSCCHLNLL